MVDPFALWYQKATEKPDKISEVIYLQWREQLERHISQTFSAQVAADSDFRRRKILTYLFPYLMLQQSPFAIPDLRTAVSLLRSFYERRDGAKLCIFADSDADGLTAAAILYIFLRDVLKISTERLVVLIPGENDKFGISDSFVDKILGIVPRLLITLDCGSSDRQTLSRLKQAAPDIELIIIDHHTLPETPQDYPPADAFVNPRRLSATDENNDLCTAAIVYKLIRGLLLSYSAGYGAIYELEGEGRSLFVQDGILIAEAAGAQKVSWRSTPGALNLEQLWQQEIHANGELYRLDGFLQKVPEALTEFERFVVLQNALSRKTEEKSRYALPLAAAGIVADLMPLWSDNRLLLREGLRQLSHNSAGLPVGFRELLRKFDLLRPGVSESDFAFTLCPAINAADRMGSPLTAFYALTAQDPLEAARQAHELHTLNEKRKKISRHAVELLAQGLDERHHNSPVLVAYHREVHRGISGLVANRLAENHRKPVLVLVDDGDSVRGSARSYRNEDIFGFVSLLKDRFIQFGGHRAAAGFSIAYEETAFFIDEVYRRAPEFFSREEDIAKTDDSLHPKLYFYESELSISHWDSLLAFAPYGKNNPLPEVIVTNEKPFEISYMGSEKNHAKISFAFSPAIDIVWFFAAARARELNCAASYQWVTEPSLNYFQGRLRYQLKVKDVIPAENNIQENIHGG